MIEIRNGMIFDFYMRLSHIVSIAVFTELDSQNRQEGAVHVKSCSRTASLSLLISLHHLLLLPLPLSVSIPFYSRFLPSIFRLPPLPQCKLHWHKQGDYLCVKVDHWMTKSKKVTSLAMMILCMLVLIMFGCYNANRYTCYLCVQ